MVAHEVVRSIEVDAAVDDLWRAVTEAESLCAWFDGEVEIDVRVGGRVSLVERDGSVSRGTVETVVRERELVFRWWSERGGTRVRFVLEPRGGGTRLTVVESQLAGPGAGARGPRALATA